MRKLLNFLLRLVGLNKPAESGDSKSNIIPDSEQLPIEVHHTEFGGTLLRRKIQDHFNGVVGSYHYPITEIAKLLDISAIKLNKFLYTIGVQQEYGRYWRLTDNFTGHNYTHIVKFRNAGGVMHWTTLGSELIGEKIEEYFHLYVKICIS